VAWLRRARRYLFEGLALVAPTAATLWVLWWLFRKVDGILGPRFDPILGRSAPGLGIVALVLILIVIGWLTERALGRRLANLWDWTLEHIPVARPIYRGSRRIVQAVMGQESRAFKEAVLLEFPQPGTWVVAFVTGQPPDRIQEDLGEDSVTVFLPTAPNPMSGFLLMAPRSKVRTLDVDTEEAMTFVLSMGSVAMVERVPRP
jgi:uncharacterized membrane protein